MEDLHTASAEVRTKGSIAAEGDNHSKALSPMNLSDQYWREEKSGGSFRLILVDGMRDLRTCRIKSRYRVRRFGFRRQARICLRGT